MMLRESTEGRDSHFDWSMQSQKQRLLTSPIAILIQHSSRISILTFELRFEASQMARQEDHLQAQKLKLRSVSLTYTSRLNMFD